MTEQYITAVKSSFLIWRLLGVWNDGRSGFLYTAYRWLFHGLFTFLYIGCMLLGAVTSDNLEQFWHQGVYMMITELAMAVKTIVGFYQFGTLIRLYQKTISREFCPSVEPERQMWTNYRRKLNSFLMWYLVCSFGAVSTNLGRLLARDYQLPFYHWVLGIPYDEDHALNFGLLFAYQCLGMMVHCALNVAGDNTVCYLLGIGGLQLDLLEYRFASVKPSTGRSFQSGYVENVRHFNEVVRFIAEVERIYSLPMFCQICASGLTICAIAFRLSSINFITHWFVLPPMLLYLSAMVAQIYLPCYFGNEVTLKSERLIGAIFHSEWYRLNLDTRRDVKMLMIRLNRPVKLKAEGFFGYNLQTFTSTLNTAYSLFAVLQRRSETE